MVHISIQSSIASSIATLPKRVKEDWTYARSRCGSFPPKYNSERTWYCCPLTACTNCLSIDDECVIGSYGLAHLAETVECIMRVSFRQHSAAVAYSGESDGIQRFSRFQHTFSAPWSHEQMTLKLALQPSFSAFGVVFIYDIHNQYIILHYNTLYIYIYICTSVRYAWCMYAKCFMCGKRTYCKSACWQIDRFSIRGASCKKYLYFHSSRIWNIIMGTCTSCTPA